MTVARVVLVTCPDFNVGRSLARALVERRLIACANLIPGVTSIYRYEGVVHEDAEVLLVCKTVGAHIEELEQVIRALHPYDVPECVTLTPARVEAHYLDWLAAETQLG